MKYIVLTGFFIFSVLLFQAVSVADQSQSQQQAYQWLQKVSSAPRHLNFSGTFVYYANGHIETSQITHHIDQEIEYERIEHLDGVERIVYRHNDEVKCYIPNSKKIYSEKRWFRKFFPDLLPYLSTKIRENYEIETGNQERVAGFETQVVQLIPKDNLRYGYKFWAHIDSGLLIKAAVLDHEDIVEQFSFTRLEIGGKIDMDIFNPELIKASENWKTIDLLTVELDLRESVWQLEALPDGFTKIAGMKRKLVGKSKMVDHIVLSDELAYVSIFIEPKNTDEHATPLPGFYSSRGAINIYVRELENNKITTVGEVPLNTVKLIGDAVFVQ